MSLSAAAISYLTVSEEVRELELDVVLLPVDEGWDSPRLKDQDKFRPNTNSRVWRYYADLTQNVIDVHVLLHFTSKNVSRHINSNVDFLTESDSVSDSQLCPLSETESEMLDCC